MGTNVCSQPASKSSRDSQDFGDISMVLKMAPFCKSTGPQWVNVYRVMFIVIGIHLLLPTIPSMASVFFLLQCNCPHMHPRHDVPQPFHKVKTSKNDRK